MGIIMAHAPLVLIRSAQVPFGGNLGEKDPQSPFLLSGPLVLDRVCGYLTVIDS